MDNEGRSIEARGVSIEFGHVRALADLTFTIEAGERVAILGPNGAGKTTLLRALAGLVHPTRGALLLAGQPLLQRRTEVRAGLGVLGHQTYLYPELTARENLVLYGRLYGIQDVEARAAAVLEQVGLFGRRHDRVDSLSRGLQQRVAIARAVLHDPPVLLLDEPDTGLDLAAFELLARLLLEGQQRRTLLVATHNIEQARRLCHRALVLVAGRLAADLPVEAMEPVRLQQLYRARPLAPN